MQLKIKALKKTFCLTGTIPLWPNKFPCTFSTPLPTCIGKISTIGSHHRCICLWSQFTAGYKAMEEALVQRYTALFVLQLHYSNMVEWLQ